MGDGHYGAPRGDRKHRGVDYICRPGDYVYAPCDGIITRHGFPYSGDETFRLIEITDYRGWKHVLMYVTPILSARHSVKKEQTIIGTAQDVSTKYQRGRIMHPHIHYQIEDLNGEYLDVDKL
jgi:hypothetical protein